MPTDIEGMLHRVVSDVFGASVEVDYSDHPKAVGHIFRARLTSSEDSTRTAGLRASHEWSDAVIFDLDTGVNVSATLFEYDDDASKEDNLRALALVLRAYLRGEGRVEHRPSMFRRRPRPRYVVTIDGREWRLGKSSSRVAYPK
ncbi:hypothetical protein ASE12_15225 [Aeromicrobium sp. Root236]|uniref:hypothetical protein n=1 Tax=Aeromicrobium sp. Root236 TaxID=1736498 RepID=UPI0006F784D9|nr:hypothetical protein [Aeromicrobium sp. Root236]KRC65988.1 hypothetical protein ASE12_15225 [Aeromicrobium sp. Root236]